MRTIHTIARACVCRFLTTTQKVKLEIRVSQNLAKLRGRLIKCQGWKGESIGVNWVAWEGEFQHWL